MQVQVLDPTVQVAFIGIFTTFVTTAGIVAVAFINNRRERHGAAGSGADKASEQEIRAKDATIAAKNAMIEFKDEQIKDLRQEVATKDMVIHTKDEQIARLKDELEKRVERG